MLFNGLSKISAPLSVNLEVTDKCNLSCSFCFNAAPAYEDLMQSSTLHQDQKNKSLNLKMVRNDDLMNTKKERLLRILDVLAEAGVFQIRLFGGEFTVFKAWREVLKYAHEKRFLISFVSNGFLLDEEDVELLSKYGVKDCTISVHGPAEVHDRITRVRGSFDRAMRSFKLLEERGITVSIAYTPIVENLKHVYNFVELLKTKYEVKHFSISRLFNDNRYKHLKLSDYHYLLREIEKCHLQLGVNISLADSFPRCQVPVKHWRYLSYCSQGVGFAQVDFNGNLKHCSATSKPIGNLLESSVQDLWVEKLEAARKLDHLPKSCKICPIFCGGGCTVSRGVDHQFAPDEFIPWPMDEGWIDAILKAGFNRIRRIIFSIFYSNQKEFSKISIPIYPKVGQRYRIRKESENVYLCMLEGSGTKSLSALGAHVLALLTGEHTLDSIMEDCRMSFPRCTRQEVEDTVRSLL
ncbi:hypothetical protein A3C91_03965 [Candidatus Azambacteria bacterium RIFCSPHIGHO2_02_FULL_52_12]|uniref:Radical SAM core domain-containing protein n=1 Tax=Candidatus Azambacteria bacterium RIFCSPLOWO2_01_FULL_46_25 TaxID=1797298 RepID=A0A1F5BUX2_9BACT|nr:MAG: hypothetical protein A3C91_03965 [Candidatus Azambacteria bacterium RIFCSPHIGHO2_02_FULL_52_12]OGD34407.1 MAG: hypothetical protein A2988_02670 [Candidatus Azambacteria bacterium RIFCSPLOWO2_01_FULL_46_25]OGD37315.1 MAG: hypothetical protein A2850_01220 [Candidatus Azambacteria bacterium RIFCSPHIGHO2_01_FULL_51_74]